TRRPPEGALLVAATLVAAIRLRGEPINPSPHVVATITDSIGLARMVLSRLRGSVRHGDPEWPFKRRFRGERRSVHVRESATVLINIEDRDLACIVVGKQQEFA